MFGKKLAICLVFVFVLLSRPIFADEITLKATVDSNQIALGDSTRLVLTVSGTQKADPIDLPVIDGFDARYLGPQTQVSIVNGNYSASKSFIYVLFSTKTGTFTIPALSFTIDGKEYLSEPIQITVEDTATAGGQGTTSGSPGALTLQDKIMLTLDVPKTEVYLHEQIPLGIKLFFGGVSIGDVQYPTFDTAGLTKTDFAEPEQTQQVLNGMGFNVVNFKTLISPTRTGEFTIGPAQLQANLIYRSQNQGASSMFGSDVFDNFFTSYERRPFTVNSTALRINVLPLPDEGKPEGFSGAVGKYDFTVTATPELVKVGDPITLRMTVSGQGDLKTITMPSFTDASFKIYDPQIKDEGNAKVLEQVIIPTTTDIKEVPRLSFSYFDTESRKYETITRGPFPVVVSAPSPGEEFKAVGFETSKPSVQFNEEVGRDIVFIKEHLDDLRPQGYRFYKTWAFGAAVILYLCVWVFGLSMYFLRRKLKTDERFARKIKAPRHARQGLEQAKTLLHQNDPKEFYTAVIKTLTDYIGNRCHIASGGLTGDGVIRILKDKRVDGKIVESIRHLFDTADSVRFASVRCDQRKMNDDFEELRSVITYLEKRL